MILWFRDSNLLTSLDLNRRGTLTLNGRDTNRWSLFKLCGNQLKSWFFSQCFLRMYLPVWTKDRGGKPEGSHSFSLSAERCLALGFFPHFLLKVVKAQLQLPGLGQRSDGTASHGSWGPSWPPRLCRSQGMDLPLSLLDRVELNCPFYFFFNTFASCLSGTGTG